MIGKCEGQLLKLSAAKLNTEISNAKTEYLTFSLLQKILIRLIETVHTHNSENS